MNGFVLRATIESRKIVFLSLMANMDPRSYSEVIDEDTYIVTLQETHATPIISLSKSNLIQSLVTDVEDLSLGDLETHFSYDAGQRVAVITLTNSPDKMPDNSAGKSYQKELSPAGLNLQLDNDNAEIALYVEQLPNFIKSDIDAFYVNFILQLAGKPDYQTGVKIFLTSSKSIRTVGFDFGSEASQMREGGSETDAAGIPRAVNLFSDIRNRLHSDKSSINENFVQYESKKLYKSIFYLRNSFTTTQVIPAGLETELTIDKNDINLITLRSERTDEFSKSWIQIPNLKLMHDNDNVANEYTFMVKDPGGTYPYSLRKIHTSIYETLLREMLYSYIIDIRETTYLKFTILVPNIYDINQINKIKSIIRKIISTAKEDKKDNALKAAANRIKALEISSISESDAAFYGCYDNIRKKSKTAGQYYIIVDCGKGTTDYSIIKSSADNGKEFIPVYRNGFAGAGNLISFAIFQGILHYLKTGAIQRNQEQHYNAFIEYFQSGEADFLKTTYFQKIEEWKIGYDASSSPRKVTADWEAKKSIDLNEENLFSKTRTPPEIASHVLSNIAVCDWKNHVQATVAAITGKLSKNLTEIIEYLHRDKSKCGGILLTGRGFHFKPLEQAVKLMFRGLPGLKNVQFLNDETNIDLKGVCLDGVFTPGLIIYNDVASTPIEIDKESNRRFTRVDRSDIGLLSRLENLLSPKPAEIFNERMNIIEVNNLDLKNCYFNIGGKVFKPRLFKEAVFVSARIIHSRKGFFIRARDTRDKIHILQLSRVFDYKGHEADQQMVSKSLFPGGFDPALIK